MNGKRNRLNDKHRFILISAIYFLLQFALIRKIIGTSLFAYVLVLLTGLYGLILWVNTYGKNSLHEIKDQKLKSLLYFLIFCVSLGITYGVFRNHTEDKLFVEVYSVIVPSVDILLFFFFFSAFEWHISYKNIFLVSNLVLGIAMMMYIPPGEVPDEQDHINAAFYVSNKIMHLNENHYNVLQKDEAAVASHFYAKSACHSYDTYNVYLNELFSSDRDNELVKYSLDGYAGDEILYFMPAIGITLGRAVDLSAYSTILLGRLFNFLFYTLLTYISFSILPIGQSMLFAVTLLPMTLQQVMSVSYDVPLFAFSFLAFSLTLHNIYKSEKYDKKDLIVSILIFILMFNIKSHAYFLIGMMPLLVIIQRYLSTHLTSKTKKIIKWSLIVLLLAVVVLYAVLYLNGTIASMRYTPDMTDWHGAIDLQESYSIGYCLKHPAATVWLMLNTLICNTNTYYRQMIGSELGWLSIELPSTCINIISILLLLSTFKVEGDDAHFLDHQITHLILVVCVLTICFIFGGMAIGWTPVTYDVVMGVQGRYFIPVLPFMYILLKKVHITAGHSFENMLVFMMGMISAITVSILIIAL